MVNERDYLDARMLLHRFVANAPLPSGGDRQVQNALELLMGNGDHTEGRRKLARIVLVLTEPAE